MIKTLIITIIFNNISYTPDLEPAWGFAVWIQTDQGVFLFDTGSDGKILRHNIRHLKNFHVKQVAPSHCTGDHVINRFRSEWKNDFLDLSLGRIYSYP